MKTAAEALQRWQAAGPAAQQAWVAGITSTQKDQAALAAAAQPQWLAGVQAAAAANRFANGVTKRGTGYWKSQSEAKAPSYGLGYSAGGPNFAAAIGKIINAEQQIVASLPPRGDINANLQRANQVALQLHAQRGNLGAV